MLLKNIDTENGLINGARGVVIDIDIIESNIEAVKIQFNHIINPVTIVRQICHSYCLDNGRKIELYQFPINLCWATKAHKSQGQTLERVAINIGEEAFAHGALYVALSRVRSIDDMILFGQNEWPKDGLSFHVNSYIRGEMLQNFQ